MPHRPLLGNWFEEEVYERDRKRLVQSTDGKMRDAASEVNMLKLKMAHHNTPCPNYASIAEDGYLHFYKPVMLQNACTLGFLSLDLDDRRRCITGWQVDCATAPASEATLRNTFVLIPSPVAPTDSYPVPESEKNIVHYGQPFYVMTVAELCADPLSLMSEYKSISSASRVTGKLQSVYFSPDGGSAEAMWCADYVEPDFREDYRDRPVSATDILLIRHNMTNAPLASWKEVFFNDFGAQNEVGCGRLTMYASKRKAGPHVNENYWIFVHRNQGTDNDNEEQEDSVAVTSHTANSSNNYSNSTSLNESDY